MTKPSNRVGADPGNLDALAAAIAPKVATLVLAQLATALGATQAPYSTRQGYEPPEFTGRPKVWRTTAPTIPGAVRIGRWWSVSRAAYAAWIAAQSSTPAPAANDTAAEPWSAASALASVGLRATR